MYISFQKYKHPFNIRILAFLILSQIRLPTPTLEDPVLQINSTLLSVIADRNRPSNAFNFFFFQLNVSEIYL